MPLKCFLNEYVLLLHSKQTWQVSIHYKQFSDKKFILSSSKGQMQQDFENFSFVEKPFTRNISYTNIKQNQLLKTITIFEWTVALNTWKSNNVWELHENEPEMAAPGVEMNMQYLWHQNWRACFHNLEVFKFRSRIFWSSLTSQCIK